MMSRSIYVPLPGRYESGLRLKPKAIFSKSKFWFEIRAQVKPYQYLSPYKESRLYLVVTLSSKR